MTLTFLRWVTQTPDTHPDPGAPIGKTLTPLTVEMTYGQVTSKTIAEMLAMPWTHTRQRHADAEHFMYVTDRDAFYVWALRNGYAHWRHVRQVQLEELAEQLL